MWLFNSSVGRKFVMALTGACLVLFVTFHCLMNSVAIAWPEAYNSICEFLGANWYALIASAGLAVLVIIHIIYAVWLTVQNRKARGSVRYSIEKRPASVEWSSKNMLVLGIVILAFLVVHLIQFWAKMQLQEIRGVHDVLPPAAGTLFLQIAFEQVYTPIVYIIGFVALWFHMNHGFWSMFQSVGWDSTVWIPRLKKIGCWWVSIVIALFIAQAIVFTVQAHNKFFLRDARLRDQYKEMLVPMYEKDFGPDAAQTIASWPYETFSMQMHQMGEQFSNEQFVAAMAQQNPEFEKQAELVNRTVALLDILEEGQPKEVNNPMFMGQPQQ
ncbi:MAG: succinate dehydrogenase cytochrome b subunit [Bacteroides sp.]|nr:succinate dehydrogenase cytochrome b subunit [Bacteroidales bacterium]MBD5337308.1 succinate dehydrogenase cytochrome b subunit [Bacteroides sp.]